MTFFDSVLLGIVEGVTEFLPISSTGHLILASSLLKIESTEFVKTFEIAVQLGAIMSVVALYWRYLFDWQVVQRVALAFIPTAVIGLAFYHVVKSILLGSELVVVCSLAIGGCILIAFEYLHSEKSDAISDIRSMPLLTAFYVGLFQSIAIIPGVSRSGATILGGLLLGLTRTTIVEFSFLLAAPTMAAATALDLLKTSNTFSGNDLVLLCVGALTAFIVASASIRWLLSYVQTHTFIPFGIYRIVLALIFFITMLSS